MTTHISRDTKYRMPAGAQACGTEIRLFIETDAPEAIIRFWDGGHAYLYEMKKVPGGFEHTAIMPETPGVIWYYFMLGDKYYGNAPDNLGGQGETYLHEPPSFQITVYDPAYKTPDWLKDGMLMQIMPDRFCRAGNAPCTGRMHDDWYGQPEMRLTITGDNAADDFYGGDLRGITEKLSYIRSLGVTVIYLNPIFKSHSNHKYDTADYMTVDPGLGTEDDFKALCAEAKKRGIRIILDGVFSHTGADSVYFNKYGRFDSVGAYNSKESEYFGWYKFNDWPEDYSCWWGFDTLPNVNKDAPSFRDFIINKVCPHWLKAGASGWRLDVADELPMDFIAAFRAKMREVNPESALMGEVWEDPSRKVAYGKLRSYCLGDTLDCVMNYPLRQAVLGFLTGEITAGQCARIIESLWENTPECFTRSNMNLLGSHDKPRALAVLADAGNMEPDRKYRFPIKLTNEQYERGKRRLIAAWNMLCALPGMPAIYYGDEAGLYGMADPFCRAAYPWGREDGELISAFREAGRRRAESEILKSGAASLFAPSEDVLIITRKLGGGKITLTIDRRADTAVWTEEK